MATLRADPLEPPLAWWQDQVGQPILQEPRWVSFDLEVLLVDTLSHAPRIRAIAGEPLIAEAAIVEAEAAFDPRFLLESGFGRTSDPVGNTLVTGGPPRLRESTWTYEMGIEGVGRYGTRLEATQQLGLMDNNSVFLTPRHQGNARLSVSLTQPLLAGAGRLYNERLLLQARIDADVAWQDTLEEVQERLADVFEAYWRLYELRVELLQRRDLLRRGRELLERLEQRASIDTAASQLVRARAAAARREADLIRAAAEVRDQQSRLRALVGSPSLEPAEVGELIPRGLPVCTPVEIDIREAATTGIKYRPQVRLAARKLEAAALEVKVARNELLPRLDAVIDTYVAGLNGSSRVGGSWMDQFSEGEPGYNAGLQLEVPMFNRAAEARHRRSRWRLAQKSELFRETLQQLRAEIEIAVRNVNASRAEMEAKAIAASAARNEEDFLARRWQLLPGEDGVASLLLEDLLDAQERRTAAERDWVRAKVGYLVSLARLQQSMGTLLMAEEIVPMRTEHGDLPAVEFMRRARDR